MDSYSFYKSLYDRELARKIHLDSAANIPITILTLLVGSFYFVLKELYPTIDLACLTIYSLFIFVVILGTFCSLVISIIFLVASYNNYFKGYGYIHLGNTRKIRIYETETLPEDNKSKNRDVKFESVIIGKLTSIIDNHTYINDKRGVLLFKSRTMMIVSLILIFLQLILLIFKYL